MKKILLIEDDPQLAENIADILMLDGYIVFVAVNGNKGQQTLFSCKPDIIISDVLMPEMNGIELVQLIRKDPRHRNIPIILLSAKTTEQDIRNGENAGANIYLKKPFNTEELLHSVSKLLDKEAA